MKSIIKQIIFGVIMIVGAFSAHAQCLMNADFNEFEAYGMSSTIEWQPITSQNVVCNSSDWQPSFFVNNDSLLNVKISGQFFISSESGDDDFIGFVFGYKTPNNSSLPNDNRFFLFDWKKTAQTAPQSFGGFFADEGFSLNEARGLLPSDPINTYRHFWAHENGDFFTNLATDFGDNKGWEYDVEYNFQLIYTYNKIIIRINNEEIFNLDGCFKPGMFGLYSLNQNGAVFQDINIEQYYQIKFETDEVDFCEEKPVDFHFIDTECSNLPPNTTDFEWYFGDGSDEEYEFNPQHVYFDPGAYEIELRVTNTEGCIDTVTKRIFIEPKPQIVQHPQDQYCYVGDQVSFTVDIDYAETYQWYYFNESMGIWSKVINNGYFNGAKTPELKIYNVRPNFEDMKFRCVVNGKCFNLVTTQFASIKIEDIPVRAYINPLDNAICSQDSTTFLIKLEEPYQIKDASLRLLYNPDDFEFNNYSTYFQNMDFEFEQDSNYIQFDISVTDPVNLDEAIIATLSFTAIGNEIKPSYFEWDTTYTYFIDENSDTIFELLYNTHLNLFATYESGLEDSIVLCRGEAVSVDGDYFSDIQWSNGAFAEYMIPGNDGDYSIQLTDVNGCYSEDTFNIVLKDQPIPPVSIVSDQNYYCTYEDTIKISIEGGYGDYMNVSFNDSVLLLSTSNGEYAFLNPDTTSTIYASWSNTCGTSDSIGKEIIIIEEAYPNISLSSDHLGKEIGDLVTITAEITDGGAYPNINWYVDDSLVQDGFSDQYISDQFTLSQEVKVDFWSSHQCYQSQEKVTDELMVELQEQPVGFFIPSLVTPDGDGENDSFRVFMEDEDLIFFDLHIFDIIGRELFNTNNINKEYLAQNVMSNGGVQIFTYYLVYQYRNGEKTKLSGKFLLKK